MIGRSGRDDALIAALMETIRSASANHGRAVLMWGEVGSGKTTLLDELAERHAGPVLRCWAAPDEAGVPLAAVHQLLWACRTEISELSDHHRAILAGVIDGSVNADVNGIAPAILSLLVRVAGDMPLLVLIDDAENVDADSARILAFIARRIRSERLVMIAASFAAWGQRAFGEWDRMMLGPLDDSEAEVIVSARPDQPDAAEVARIVAAAAGNPLVLVSMPIPDRAPTPLVPHDPGSTVVSRMARCLDDQYPGMRPLLVLAAADSPADHAFLLRTADADAVDAAVDAALLVIDHGTVRFASPLVRAAAYWSASAADRARAHRAWSLTWADAGDQARSAWHVATATAGRDGEIAELLLKTAETNRHRFASEDLAAMYEAAGWLSPSRERSGAMFAAASREQWSAGDGVAATELLQLASTRAADVASEITRGLEGMVKFIQGDSVDAARILARDAEIAPLPESASVRLALLGLRAGWSASTLDLDDVAGLSAALGKYRPALSESLREVIVGWRQGRIADIPIADDDSEDRAWMLPPAPYAVAWGVGERLYARFVYAADAARASGADIVLALTLSQIATLDIVAGRWDAAELHAEEAFDLARRRGASKVLAQCHNSLAWLAALRGDATAVRRHTDAALERAGARSGALAAAAQWHRGTSLLVLGKPGEALDVLAPLRSPSHPAHHPTFAALAAADAAEAAIRVDRPDEADAQIALLRAWEERTSTRWARSARTRSQALRGESGEAERLFREALDSDDGDRLLHSARTRLLFGEWLRKQRRRSEARPYLLEARELFANLGSGPFVERANTSLDLAAGLMRADAGVPGTLTEQEMRVARLAAEGLTNKQIGAQLFISPRTVGHHLSATFGKLGIAGRQQLASIVLTPHGPAR